MTAEGWEGGSRGRAPSSAAVADGKVEAALSAAENNLKARSGLIELQVSGFERGQLSVPPILVSSAPSHHDTG